MASYYVDPAVAGPGTGIITDPWVSVQAAITAILAGPGRDAVNGDQVNVRSDQEPGIVTTTDDVTAAVLNLAGYVPAVDAPLTIRGYSYAENDRGIGGMDGNNGGWSIYDGVAGATNYVHFIDMHLHNTGADEIVVLGTFSSLIQCILDTTTNQEALRAGGWSSILGNYLEGGGATYAAYATGSSTFRGNMVRNAGAGGGVFLLGQAIDYARNIIVVDDVAAWGIRISASYQWVTGNSIINTAGAGTAAGLYVDAVAHSSLTILDNLVEGFDGVGGSWLDLGNTTRHLHALANNSYFNCNAAINPGDINYEEDNEEAAATLWLAEGAITFDNRFDYFKPAIPLRGRAFPNGCRFDRGAVQVRLVTEREVAERIITTIPGRTEYDPVEE